MITGIETPSQQLAMPISGAGIVSISGVYNLPYSLDELSGEVESLKLRTLIFSMQLLKFHFVSASSPTSFLKNLRREENFVLFYAFANMSFTLKRTQSHVLVFLPWQGNVMNPITLLATWLGTVCLGFMWTQVVP